MSQGFIFESSYLPPYEEDTWYDDCPYEYGGLHFTNQHFSDYDEEDSINIYD